MGQTQEDHILVPENRLIKLADNSPVHALRTFDGDFIVNGGHIYKLSKANSDVSVYSIGSDGHLGSRKDVCDMNEYLLIE
jgi:hypothetical protein